MTVIIKTSLLHWNFHTCWNPVQILIECGSQFMFETRFAYLTLAMVSIRSNSGRVIAIRYNIWGALLTLLGTHFDSWQDLVVISIVN